MAIKANLSYILENLPLIKSVTLNDELRNDKINFVTNVLNGCKNKLTLTKSGLLLFIYENLRCRLILAGPTWLLKIGYEQYKITFHSDIFITGENEYWKNLNNVLAKCC